MATNGIPINVSDNMERIRLSVVNSGVTRLLNNNSGSPYYVGARAYVTQSAGGAVITIIDREGTTTATVLNGIDGVDGADGNGIASVTLNEDYTLTLLFTDGTSVTTTSIRGEKGDKGDSAEVESITNAELEEILV